MKIAFYLNVISPHQLPLAREVVRLVGEENFRYVYAEDFLADRKAMGWDDGDVPTWCIKGDENSKRLIDADLVYTGIRCVGLMARRLAIGKKTVYFSERWFKPRLGVFRLLAPSYRRMAREFVRLIDDGCVVYLSCGIHAARDMARLCGLMHGDLRCLFRAPRLEFENRPMGRIWLWPSHRTAGAASVLCRPSSDLDKHCLDKMRMWGYFVEPSKFISLPVLEVSDLLANQLTHSQLTTHNSIRVLWVGRLLRLKRVDTIIRAVGELSKRINSNSCYSVPRGERFHSPTPTSNSNSPIISLDIYGTGPEEQSLKKLAAKFGDVISFYPPVPIGEVRKLMLEHDVYVFGSNGYEGWGAVVSEALEEGMRVIGTYEAGASATMLSKEHLFHAGEWRALLCLLEKERDGLLPPCSIDDWTAAKAAERLLELCC